MKALHFLPLLFITVIACVPQRKVEEIKADLASTEKQRAQLMVEKKNLETENTEMRDKLTRLNNDVGNLKRDTMVLGSSLRTMTVQYDKINELNNELIQKQKALREGKEAENRALMGDLSKTQADLIRKEDELKRLDAELKAKDAELTKKAAELEALNVALQAREKRVNELQSALDAQQKAATALKAKIANALRGYKDKGLNVEERDGKIYVSLEAKLLFASGSTTVGKEGKKALKDVAKAIKDQQDLGILVEGHTDADKLSGAGVIKDNWDLSVMRATSVVRILIDNGVEPKILTAAGRGETMPVADNKEAEGKAKNRRIEIIITPDLSAVFELIGEGASAE